MKHDKLGSLALILQNPDEHDSPLGTMIRMKVDSFIRKHSLTAINRTQMVNNITQKIHDQINQVMYEQEELLKKDPAFAKKVAHARNQRRIEQNYLASGREQKP